MLAVPFGYTYGDACDGNVWLVHQDTMTDRIAPEPPRKDLSKARVQQIVAVLTPLAVGAPAAREPEPASAAAR